MLLNLMAALSLASVGAVAGISSNSQSIDDELDKCSLIERKNASCYYEGEYLYYVELPDAGCTLTLPTKVVDSVSDISLNDGLYAFYFVEAVPNQGYGVNVFVPCEYPNSTPNLDHSFMMYMDGSSHEFYSRGVPPTLYGDKYIGLPKGVFLSADPYVVPEF